MEDSDSDIMIPITAIIPFKHIKYEIYVKLANKLDPDNLVMGNNWRMLADKLGYSIEDIFVSRKLLYYSLSRSHTELTIFTCKHYTCSYLYG